MFKKLLVIAVAALPAFFNSFARAGDANFQDLPALAPNSFYNGSDGAGGFTSGGAFFGNSYDSDFASWSGFSYSNVVDTTTPGFDNQYAAITGGGAAANGATVPGATYAVAYGGTTPFINLPAGTTPLSIQLTNSTYAAISMANGDSFAKKFGGASGNDPDFFNVTLTGYTGLAGAGTATGSTTFYLADYRSADKYIVNTWQQVDLTPLDLGGAPESIALSFASSDTSDFGGETFINTPEYVDVGSLVTTPEPTATLLLAMGAAGLLLARRRRIVA